MLNLVQHLTKSIIYETLKQVQGDKLGLFTRSSYVVDEKRQTIKLLETALRDVVESLHFSLASFVLSPCQKSQDKSSQPQNSL